MLTREEVSTHASRDSCWVIINNAAYNVTNFIDAHPGGAAIILKYAGSDATAAFEPVHASDTLEKYLTSEQCLGPVEALAATASNSNTNGWASSTSVVVPAGRRAPRLSSMISISDFTSAAQNILPPTSFAFLSTGAEDNQALEWNRRSWQAVRLRPRVLRPIAQLDMKRTILGAKFKLPLIICPAGGAKLCHPEGDVLLTEAAGDNGILHCVCNNAGRSQVDIAAARREGQVLFWQIYAMKNLKLTEAEINRAVEMGFGGVALTVDAIWAGKREGDLRARLKEEEEEAAGEADTEDEEAFRREPAVRRPPVYADFTFESAIRWLRSITNLPIAIKGIQCWEDAAVCMQFGVHPWLSNHGGRQLDGAPSSVETLIDIRTHCPEVLQRCEVIVDGGVTRGSDVVKALALGARAVGVGRGFLYSMVFGRRGVNQAVQILKHEIETTMALLGVQTLDELGPQHVDIRALAGVSARL